MRRTHSPPHVAKSNFVVLGLVALLVAPAGAQRRVPAQRAPAAVPATSPLAPIPGPPSPAQGVPFVAPCLPLGAAIDGLPLATDPNYRAVARDWASLSSFTIETHHKFSFVRFGPGANDYDFSVADQTIQDLVSLGYGAGGMAFHTLFWHNRFQLDPWVETLGHQGTRTVIAQHVDAIHQHYFVGPAAFPIHRIDLLNEILSDARRLRAPGPQADENPWAQAGTAAQGYVDWAVYATATADGTFPPDTRLFYNDYGIGMGPIDIIPAHAFDPTGATHLSKADAAFKLVRDHLAPAGLDGVGLQTHLIVPYNPNTGNLRAVIRRYAEIGVEVHITELDVAIDTGGAAPTPAQLQQQAALYEEVTRIAAEEPNCTQLTIWGVTDAHTWIPTFAPHCPGCRAPLPHDDFGVPKPAYFAIENVLATVLGPCAR